MCHQVVGTQSRIALIGARRGLYIMRLILWLISISGNVIIPGTHSDTQAQIAFRGSSPAPQFDLSFPNTNDAPQSAHPGLPAWRSSAYGICLSGDLSNLRASRCSPIMENIVMRILSKRQVKELVLYSPQHIARLEKAGQFPKRVPLGPNRVGWVEREVLDWLEERVAQR